MQADTRGWNRITRFVGGHHANYKCDDPKFFAVLVLYGSWAFKLLDTALGRALFWLSPTFLGARAIVCISCRSLEFQSWWGRQMMRFSGDRFNLLFFDEDVESMPQEMRDLFGLEEAPSKG